MSGCAPDGPLGRVHLSIAFVPVLIRDVRAQCSQDLVLTALQERSCFLMTYVPNVMPKHGR